MKKKYYLILRIMFLIVFFLLGFLNRAIACAQDANSASILQEEQKIPPYSIKIIPVVETTYGYEIYDRKKLIIRQANIPGFPGVKGFKRKSDAQKVAQLVTEKLSKGMMPPTIEKAEMQKLQVQF